MKRIHPIAVLPTLIMLAAALILSQQQSIDPEQMTAKAVLVSVAPETSCLTPLSSIDQKLLPIEEELEALSTPSVKLEEDRPLFGKDLYDSYVDQITEQYYPNVPAHLIRAIITVESNYDPNVTSRAGAVGLTQLLPWYHAHRAAQYGLYDLYDPYTNIIACADLLDELYHRYGDWRMVLYRYNQSWSYVDYVLEVADRIEREEA